MQGYENKKSENINEKVKTASETAKKAGEQVKDQGIHFLDQQRSVAVNELQKVEVTLHDTAKSLKEKNSFLADLTDKTADTVGKASHFLAEKNAQEMFDSVNTYAKDHPAVVIGGLFVTGIALSRFFRTTAEVSR